MLDSAADALIAGKVLAGDPSGQAEFYDSHARGLYEYCFSMLQDQERAVGALGITFMIAAGRLAALRDQTRLRPWLYALARDECRRRAESASPWSADRVPLSALLTTNGTGAFAAVDDTAGSVLDEPADSAGSEESADSQDTAPTPVLAVAANPDSAAGTPDEATAGLFAAAVAALSWDNREIIELCLRQHLIGQDLADALGMPAGRVQPAVAEARVQLQRAIGALFVARTGRAKCRNLAQLLAGWNGRPSESLIQDVRAHIDSCVTCRERELRDLPSWQVLDGARRSGAMPPPPGVREDVLALLAEVSAPADDLVADLVKHRAGAFSTGGFPAIRIRQNRRSGTRVAGAAAGVAAAGAVLVMFAALPSGGAPTPALAQATKSAGISSGANPLGVGSARPHARSKTTAKHKPKHKHAAKSGNPAPAPSPGNTIGIPSAGTSTSPATSTSSSASSSVSSSASPSPGSSSSSSTPPASTSPPPSSSPSTAASAAGPTP